MPALPAPWNLPLQPVAGIQISILISESLVGFNVAFTRQKAGRSLNAAPCRPAPLAGGVNAPAATDSADVMVAFGPESEVKLSQDAAAATPWRTTVIVNITWNNAIMLFRLIPVPFFPGPQPICGFTRRVRALEEFLVVSMQTYSISSEPGFMREKILVFFPGLLVRLSIVDGDLVARSYLTVNKDLTPLGYLPTRCFTSAFYENVLVLIHSFYKEALQQAPSAPPTGKHRFPA